MKNKRFTEERMIGALNRQENGEKVADICRELGIAPQTFYRWKSKYGGMSVSDARRLKFLEGKNTKFKKMLAEQLLDNSALKEVLSKKW